MVRTRLVLAASVALLALLVSGCGEQDSGPSGSRLSPYSASSASREPASSSVSGLGRTPLSSGVAGDKSITDSVRAHYGDVPGGTGIDDSMLDSTLDSFSSISGDSDLDADLTSASLSSSLGGDLGFTTGYDVCETENPIDSMQTVAMTGDPEVNDAMMDDIAFDPAFDDPEFGAPVMDTGTGDSGC